MRDDAVSRARGGGSENQKLRRRFQTEDWVTRRLKLKILQRRIRAHVEVWANDADSLDISSQNFGAFLRTGLDGVQLLRAGTARESQTPDSSDVCDPP